MKINKSNITIIILSIFLFISIIFIIFLNIKISEKDNKIVKINFDNNKKIEEDLFKKKIECNKYKDTEYNKLNKEYNLGIDFLVGDNLQVFYSPSKNTCLGNFIITRRDDDNKLVYAKSQIYNVLTGEILYLKTLDNFKKNNSSNNEDLVPEMISDYKNRLEKMHSKSYIDFEDGSINK